MNKIVLMPFNGDPMCFIHVLLNALDMKERGHEVIIVIEGAACKLVGDMATPGHMLNPLYTKAKDQGLIAGVCKACSAKLGATEAVQAEGLPLIGDMSGHPSMAAFLEQGYEIITF